MSLCSMLFWCFCVVGGITTLRRSCAVSIIPARGFPTGRNGLFTRLSACLFLRFTCDPRRHDPYPRFRDGVVNCPPAVGHFDEPAILRSVPRQRFQLLTQYLVVGVNPGGLFFLVEADLSEKNNYPSKSEEYMANQVFYQIFFG